ncbi:hypothetical protein GCM10007973_08400 [Polymorphobacter multimanifer]|uniref:Uncharacterized protein n=1 Tax=Polymorphobacter multimanifer TaxID=1070431 RepID=A0A841LGM1_9SPHN|nr:hypothetical protein [Polymorphobacter multimanifer]MBB6228945.1 hypothetical protein [Polymorphobacter multimanifer]GGI73881.1 hypothetical protein GCM10007973_08400 [Polymorphobacter multimanifer]
MRKIKDVFFKKELTSRLETMGQVAEVTKGGAGWMIEGWSTRSQKGWK